MAPIVSKPAWVIEGFVGDRRIAQMEAPGSLAKGAVATLLQRLMCRHLEENEVLAASLRRHSLGREGVLEPEFVHAVTDVTEVRVGGDTRYVARQDRRPIRPGQPPAVQGAPF